MDAYYLLQPLREALILSESGAEVKSYSAAPQALLLLAVVPFYGWFATKSDFLQVGIVFLGRMAGAGISGFALLNVALTVAWLLVAGRIAAEHRKRSA
jgi:AAA family ATP:ADP antiporter